MKSITDAELQKLLGLTTDQVDRLRMFTDTKLASDGVTQLPSTRPLAKVIRAGIIDLIGK